jgi:hypothetical protein
MLLAGIGAFEAKVVVVEEVIFIERYYNLFQRTDIDR